MIVIQIRYDMNISYNQLLQLCMACTAWSDSAIKLVSVIFGKCTTLMVTKCWSMEIRLPCSDQ